VFFFFFSEKEINLITAVMSSPEGYNASYDMQAH